MGEAIFMLFSLQTMCTCTFYGLARSMYVRGVAYVCGVAYVFVFGGVPVFEMR